MRLRRPPVAVSARRISSPSNERVNNTNTSPGFTAINASASPASASSQLPELPPAVCSRSSFGRSTRSYTLLVARAYDELYYQDPTFKADLIALGGAMIQHSIGNSDGHDTTLMESEMLWHLERLRHNALREAFQAILNPVS